jgi:large subunit ribosomal protein L31e
MVIKRTYNIPLRKEFQKAPYYKKSKKAIAGLIDFLKKHMKSDIIKVGKNLNEKIWKNGIRNPPHHIEVTAIKGDDGVVNVELAGLKKETKAKSDEVKPAKTDVKSADVKETPKKAAKAETKDAVSDD